jgi:hypothetical protein
MYRFLYDTGVKDHKFIGRLLASSAQKVSALNGTLNNTAIEFETLENGNVLYRRLLSADAKRRIRSMQALMNLKRTKKDNDGFKGRFATYRFHAPKLLTGSEPGTVGRGTVEWRFPIEFKNQSTGPLEAEFSMKSQSWLWTAAILMIVASALFWFRSFWARGGLRKVAKSSGRSRPERFSSSKTPQIIQRDLRGVLIFFATGLACQTLIAIATYGITEKCVGDQQQGCLSITARAIQISNDNHKTQGFEK